MMVPPPSAATSVPSQVETPFAGVARVTPAGKVSVNARSVVVLPSTSVMVNVSVLTLPGPIVLGLNVLVNAG